MRELGRGYRQRRGKEMRLPEECTGCEDNLDGDCIAPNTCDMAQDMQSELKYEEQRDKGVVR